jgi:hypothetical protein
MGPSAARMAAEGLELSVIAVTATYGPVTGREYIATSCSVTVAGTEVRCTTAQGYGLGHFWRLSLAVALPRAVLATATNASVRTGYLPPTITQLFVQGTDPGDANANVIATCPRASSTCRNSHMGPSQD